MSLSKRLLSMLPAIQRVRTAPRKLTSTIRALEPWKYPKSLHQGKNEKNGIAEAIPFLSCLTMFSYREAPLDTSFFVCSSPAGFEQFECLRSAAVVAVERPPDVLRRLVLSMIQKRDIRWMALFCMFGPSRARTVQMSPLHCGRSNNFKCL